MSLKNTKSEPAQTAVNPFSKGYKYRDGQPVSDACGDDRHAECTQDLTKCHCHVRSGHTTMHAYMNPAGLAQTAGNAPELFRSKSVEKLAMRWTGENAAQMREFCESVTFEWIPEQGERQAQHNFCIATLEGVMRGSIGDWLIRGVADEFYPCKPDVFADSYERVAASSQEATPPKYGDCFLCKLPVEPTAGDPAKWPMELMYHGGNGETRLYCMGCVIDAIANASPVPAFVRGSAELAPSPATKGDKEIDEAFARMGKDEKYLKESARISKDFAASDWEALQIAEGKVCEEIAPNVKVASGDVSGENLLNAPIAERSTTKPKSDAPSPATKETPPCQHERLDEDGYCRRCGADMRSGVNLSDTQVIAELRQMVAVLQAQIASDAGAKSVVAAPQNEIVAELLKCGHILKQLLLENSSQGRVGSGGSKGILEHCNDWNKAEALAGAAALPSAQNEWISVEERLPEKFEQVFAYMKPVAEGPSWYPRTNVTLAWHKRGIWFGAFIDPMSGKVENGEMPEDLVTHWSELPSPPVPSKAKD